MSREDDGLPSCFRWMLTFDNQLDALWKQGQHLNGYPWLNELDAAAFEQSSALRWLARTLWLIRNPAAGLSAVWGVETCQLVREVIFHHGAWDSGRNMCRLQVWRDTTGRVHAWQLQAQLFYRKGGVLFCRANLGWKSVSGRSRLIYTNHINPVRPWKTSKLVKYSIRVA